VIAAVRRNAGQAGLAALCLWVASRVFVRENA
jgi:hypothetical protein